MPRVTPVAEIGIHRAPCTATVRIAREGLTNTAKMRIHRAKRNNLPPEQCGDRSDFMVDGKPMCRRHAQAWALDLVMEQGL